MLCKYFVNICQKYYFHSDETEYSLLYFVQFHNNDKNHLLICISYKKSLERTASSTIWYWKTVQSRNADFLSLNGGLSECLKNSQLLSDLLIKFWSGQTRTRYHKFCFSELKFRKTRQTVNVSRKWCIFFLVNLWKY